MDTWQLRVRAPDGSQTVTLAPSSSVADLRLAVEDVTGISVPFQALKFGRPPKLLGRDGDELTLEAAGLANRETLMLSVLAEPEVAAVVSSIQEPALSSTRSGSSPASSSAHLPPAHADPELPAGGWACPACTFSNAAVMPVCEMCGSPSPASQGKAAAALVGGMRGPQLHTSGTMVRRVMADDNSCCFTSISYLMYGDRGRAAELRELIAATAGADPERWNAATLGKPVAAYQAWIRSSTSWGGGIELAILADYFAVEIAVMDAQTMRMDVFGSGSDYSTRIYVLYTGIHYDALALAVSESAPETADVRTFLPDDVYVEDLARGVVAHVNSAHGFTDVGSFALFCQDCGTVLRGQKAAVEHASKTGHGSFVEYRE
ncbi:ubiquitin thioesterase OTU1 [Thecamonas trahens ATCC 50062]|uniref:Ubiquitin thioesterase OTU n=1 Tax=Thecamonas trahens ATCC 50062 TaxID=461836 RepID=A0A0L0DAB5_THETB|nr:ubiquitin thioesterase OTU1 [Thecamonas trahens ATCC 50062]KNC48238.1 ubiquitin thioesterase OTU1 [Thecamonas trahens ATCC 50062]|eukprot:XP_013758807.1 ubiquitin thioesterase OTU1 [Thecamonas trahens ATCC 50062]